jgi:hypothetical protein
LPPSGAAMLRRLRLWWSGIGVSCSSTATGSPATLVLTGAPEGGHDVLRTGFFEDAARAIVASVPSAEHRRIPNQSHQVDPRALAPVLAAFYKG